MSDAHADELRLSTKVALFFAAASILLFHGFNAYVYFAGRKACSPPPAANA